MPPPYDKPGWTSRYAAVSDDVRVERAKVLGANPSTAVVEGSDRGQARRVGNAERVAAGLMSALLVLVGGCQSPGGPPAQAPVTSPPPSGRSPAVPASPEPAVPGPADAAGDPVLVGAGDIASCVSDGDEATARLLDRIPGTVYTTGDNAYGEGTAEQFETCYGDSWGRHRDRTRPSPGNHDYVTAQAAGYFDYFGAAAGPRGRGYYSYQLGAWHVVALNSNCWAVGGCGADSPQQRWLAADLAAAGKACTLAYWHHPLFTSGSAHDNATDLRPIFQTLYDHGAEVVLTGHNHNYERFAPQDPAGRPDPARGIRQFVVGTGGASHYGFDTVRPNSEVRDATAYGVLKVTLRPSGYDWQFVPVAGRSFTDAGTGTCHR